MLFGHDLSFWMSVAGATVVKLFTTPHKSILHTGLTIFAAVFSAWAFTDPALAWLKLDPAAYKAAIAALLALTGEGIMRALITAAADPTKALDLVRAWRGGK